ncbi:sorting nexin-18-like [Watersipora subatra]|uniref:sorting nexin-18-like n=1 Tax=Watersipora subatra TaxID=2589382 RepID=UPI00355B58A3
MAVKQAQVIYDFVTQTEGELQLAANEIITIVNEDVGEGWWEARNQRGETGFIPKDYVELIVSPSLPEPSMPPPPLPNVQSQTTNNSWGQPPQSSWDQPQASHAAPSHAASAPGADEDDWEDEWSDDGGSSVGDEHASQMGDNQQRLNVPRREGTTRTKTAGRISTYNKLGFDMQLMSHDAQNVPENEKIRIIETANGWEWEENREPFSCLVDSPKKSSKLKGLKSFIVYQLTPSFSGIAVQRRYKHFDWLQGRFAEKYPTIVIPPLPDKQISGRYEEDFINERMKQLQEWVTRITNHPVVSRSQVWKHFLTCTDEKSWKKGKRDAEHDKYKGGRFFHTLVTPPKPLDSSKVEKDVENFASFVKKMEDGVRELSSASTNQYKKYTHHFKKEYEKVSEAVNVLKESFECDGCANSASLNSAIADTSKAYLDIATMFHQQPRRDWLPLNDNLLLYKGILSGFDATLSAQKVASTKVRESLKMRDEGKITESDVQAFTSHADAISFSLYAEINHFQSNRQQEFKIMMQNLLAEQINFHQRITQRLEEAKRHYDAF